MTGVKKIDIQPVAKTLVVTICYTAPRLRTPPFAITAAQTVPVAGPQVADSSAAFIAEVEK